MAVQAVSHWMQACVVLQLCLSEVQPAARETRRSYYDLLNVAPTATDSQIKKSFRKMAIKYHPDKNKSADAEKTFREIAEAYRVLSSNERRRRYDSVGHEVFLNDDAPVHPEGEQEEDFPFSFADLFHAFDDDPFAEESFSPFHQDGEGAPHEHGSFVEPGFTFDFGDENEEYAYL